MQTTDFELAKKGLDGHTLCLCRDGRITVSDLRGIAPMMNYIAEGRDLRGCCVADVVVGKAAAMLFVKSGVVKVYAKTISRPAKEVLERFGVDFEYGVLTERIINRAGTDTCPMEKTVSATDDVEEAYVLLKNKLNQA